MRVWNYKILVWFDSIVVGLYRVFCWRFYSFFYFLFNDFSNYMWLVPCSKFFNIVFFVELFMFIYKLNSLFNLDFHFVMQSVAFTAVPFFVVGGIWFVLFGLTLSLICLVYCCCRRERYGYSRIAYALSLIFLVLFTIAAM